jgi:hypothetical protein
VKTVNRHELIKELNNSSSVKRSDIVYRKMRDPALLRYYYKIKTVSSITGNSVYGNSPTDIFVGRYNYPYVSVGPLVPPEFGDTSVLSSPELWRNLDIERIVEMRSKLVRGMHIVKVTDIEKGRMAEQIRDLALSERFTGTEMSFVGKPFLNISLRDEVSPFGPSGKMSSLSVENMPADKKVESLYSDDDATAKTALVELYERGVPFSRIQRALSAGLFGIKRNRRFVPTRWSITAVDDTLSKSNLEEVKSYNPVDAIHAYYNVALDNRWLIFLIPGKWEYESIEAWYPKTVWNEDGVNISIFGSYEGYWGRKTYAEIGGCYYSGRLAITEKLRSMKRQAMALILREVHDGYLMPVGVWNVREHVRQTLEEKPIILNSYQDMMKLAEEKLDIRKGDWIKNSRMLRELSSQMRISRYVG